MTLRILYHHRTQGRGAEGLHISRIVLALREMGHEVTVVSPPGIDPLASLGGQAAERADAKKPGVSRLWMWISRNLPGSLFEVVEVLYNVSAYIRLRRIMATQKFDLVYERYAFFLVAGSFLAHRYGVPFVLEANEVNGIEARVRKQSFPRLCRSFERALFARCAAIHTVSSYLRQKIIDAGVPANRVFVAPNAFDVRAIPSKASTDDLRRKFGLQGRSVIGFAGWFSDWDRLDFFIDVLGDLAASHPGLALLLIGDGPMVPRLREQVKRLGLADTVVFSGPVQRSLVYDHIAMLDVAVLPHSNRFGSPVVMFEFMGLKIPVVAPRLEPILDVQVDGETALLFDPLNREQCAQAIGRLLADAGLREQLAQAAYAKLLANHTWQCNAENILSSVRLV